MRSKTIYTAKEARAILRIFFIVFVSSYDFEGILIDDSATAIADIKILPFAADYRFNLFAFGVAGKESVVCRFIPANAFPSVFIVYMMSDFFHIFI
jgi:hypothetical protein